LGRDGCAAGRIAKARGPGAPAVRAPNGCVAHRLRPRDRAGASTPPDPPFVRGGFFGERALLHPPLRRGVRGVLSWRCHVNARRSKARRPDTARFRDGHRPPEGDLAGPSRLSDVLCSSADTVGEFPPWVVWPVAGQDEACWEGEPAVPRRPRRIRQQHHLLREGRVHGLGRGCPGWIHGAGAPLSGAGPSPAGRPRFSCRFRSGWGSPTFPT
jgi:hypothetical protein